MKADMHLGEKNSRPIRCWKCKAISIYFPPRKTKNEKGEKVILWGPNEGMITADLTEDEIEDTVKPEADNASYTIEPYQLNRVIK